MTLTNASSRPTAALTAILSAVALLIALVGAGNQPARADKFTPLEDPPTISIEANAVVVTPSGTLVDPMDPTTDDDDVEKYDSFTAFQPAFNGSSEVYNVFATITSNADDWEKNITRVRLCIYEDDAISETNAACGFVDDGIGPFTTAFESLTEKEPDEILIIEWNKAVHDGDSEFTGFQLLDDGENKHSLVDADENGLGSQAAFLSAGGDDSGMIRFAFRVSHAMQVSSKWGIRVAVESQPPAFNAATGELWDPESDGGGTSADPAECTETGTPVGCELPDAQSGTDSTAADFEVAYFGSMTAARDNTSNFGVMALGSISTVTEIGSGRYVANDASDLLIQATDFTNGTGGGEVTVPLALTGDLDDDNSSGFAPLTGVAFDSDPQDRARDQDGDLGTWAPDNRVSLDCKFDDNDELDLSEIRSAGTPDYAGWMQVTNAARVFVTEMTATDEGGEDLDSHACALTYGGGAARANVVFSNQVDLGVAQRTSDDAGDRVTFPTQEGFDESGDNIAGINPDSAPYDGSGSGS